MVYPGNSHAKRFELKSNAFDAGRHLVYWPELAAMKPPSPGETGEKKCDFLYRTPSHSALDPRESGFPLFLFHGLWNDDEHRERHVAGARTGHLQDPGVFELGRGPQVLGILEDIPVAVSDTG